MSLLRLLRFMLVLTGVLVLGIVTLTVIVFGGSCVVHEWRYGRDKAAYRHLLDRLVAEQASVEIVSDTLRAHDIPYLDDCPPGRFGANICPLPLSSGRWLTGVSNHRYSGFPCESRARVMLFFDDTNVLRRFLVKDDLTCV